MSLRIIETPLLWLDYFLGVAIIFAQLLGASNAVSALFYGTFAATFLLWIFTMTGTITRLDALGLGLLCLSLVNVVVNGAMASSSISFEYLHKWMMFACTVIFLCAACKVCVSRRTLRFIALLYMAAGLALVVAFVTRRHTMYMVSGVESNYLTFLFTNPNLTGLFLACMSMYMLLVSLNERWGIRLLLWLMVAIETYFLYLTQSRNALIVFVIFVILLALLFLISKARSTRWAIPRWLLALVVCLPLILALIYLALVNTDTFSSMFSFLVGEGKDLDSRVAIWKNAFDELAVSPIFGAYSQISNGTGMSQLHNTHIDTLVSYGPFVLILELVFFYQVLRAAEDAATEPHAMFGVLAFCCVLLLGFGEAALVSGGIAFYLHAAAPLLFARQEQVVEKPARARYQALVPVPKRTPVLASADMEVDTETETSYDESSDETYGICGLDETTDAGADVGSEPCA